MVRFIAALCVALPAIASAQFAAHVDKWPTLPAKAGLLVQPLVSSEDVSLSLLAIAPQSSVGHDRAMSGQFFVYVLEGSLATGAAKEKPLGPNDAALLRADQANVLRNGGNKTAQVLVLDVPGSTPLDFERADGRAEEGGDVPTPIVRRSAAAKAYAIAGSTATARMLFEGEAELPAYVGVLHAEKGGLVVPTHRHENEAELLFVTQGEGEAMVGPHKIRIRPGVALLIPKGVEHSFTQSGKKPFHAVQLYTPPGPEQRFKVQK